MSFRSLVFSGGSTKIPIHVGAFKAIEESNINFESLYGTSAGAIIAAMVADGKTSQEMLDLVFFTDFSMFTKRTIPELIYNFFRRAGLVSGRYRMSFFREIFGNRKLKSLKKEIHIYAHSLKRSRCIDFSQKTCPEMEIAVALHASTAIPVFFNPVMVNYQNKKDYFIDGGVSKNFPVDLAGDNYIGHLIESVEDKIWENMTVYKMFSTAINEMVDANILSSKQNAGRGIIVSSKYDKSLSDFKINKKEKEDMISLGYQNMSLNLSCTEEMANA